MNPSISPKAAFNKIAHLTFEFFMTPTKTL